MGLETGEQAQFGKDVLGAVWLKEARRHQENAKEIKNQIKTVTDKDVLLDRSTKLNQLTILDETCDRITKYLWYPII